MTVRKGKTNGHSRPSRNARASVFCAVAFATLTLAVLLLRNGLVGPSLADLGEHVIDVRGSMSGFDPETIRVRAGETVTLRLISMDSPLHQGGGEHQLAIDELGIDLRAAARDTASTTFTPTESGTYLFYCDVCCGGRSSPSMRGAFIVEI